MMDDGESTASQKCVVGGVTRTNARAKIEACRPILLGVWAFSCHFNLFFTIFTITDVNFIELAIASFGITHTEYVFFRFQEK